jgi:AcrR family transcriptional regulator
MSGPTPRREGREREILDAATRLFHASGFDRVGVDDIGQLAGITGPAIYRYFSGKDEILAALFDSAMDRLLLLCGHVPDDPFAALEHLVTAHVEFAVRDSELLSVYAREERSLTEPWRRRLNRRQREHLDRWYSVLAQCFPDRATIEHQAAAHAAIGMIHSVGEWPRGVRQGVSLTDTLMRLVTYGLMGLGPGEALSPSRSYTARGSYGPGS